MAEKIQLSQKDRMAVAIREVFSLKNTGNGELAHKTMLGLMLPR